MKDTIKAVANAYRASVRDAFDADTVRQIDRQNASRPRGALYVHEHDYTDANMLMLDAYERVTGRTIDDGDEWLRVMNRAWRLALRRPYADTTEV
jgi:hypothetical protein